MFWYTIKHVHAHNFQVVILIWQVLSIFSVEIIAAIFYFFKQRKTGEKKKTLTRSYLPRSFRSTSFSYIIVTRTQRNFC